ncbi:hypothetical protein O0L34_g7429 [Tuta absoluta]|nr:hypothetical protein O0L34_g7429 [Tuta absoluta]
MPPAYSSVEYEQAFELTGHGRFNCLATFSCSLIFIHSIIEMVAFAYVITPAECDLGLTVVQNSAVGASVFVGILLTAIFWGILGDLYGRKKIMLPAVISSILTSFASSFCTGFWSMLIFRFLTGIAVSSSSAMVLVYLAELQTAPYRDKHVSIVIGASQFSFFFLTGFAWALIPQTWVFQIKTLKIRSWRVFMWLWGVVGLTGASILIFLPESPRYIVAVKGPTKALPILAKIYAWNHRCTPDEYPVKTIDVSKMPRHEINWKKDLKQLIQKPMRRCVYLTHAAMFMTYLLNNGFYIWHTDIMNAAIKLYNKPMTLCQLISVRYGKKQTIIEIEDYIPYPKLVPQESLQSTDSDMLIRLQGGHGNGTCGKGHINTLVYPLTLVMETFYFCPFVVVAIIINKFKKVKLYVVITSLCGLGLIMSSCVPQMMVAFCFLVLGLACGSCCSILTAMVVEAFPTSLRGIATCTMYMVGQVGAVLGTSVLSLMIGWSCHLLFALIAFCLLGTGLALLKLWPDPLKVRGIMEKKGFTY